VNTNPLLTQRALGLQIFDSIGTVNVPKFKTPAELAGFNYFIACELASKATKRKDEAKKGAEQHGILAGVFIPGETITTFRGDRLIVTATTKQPSTQLDETLLRSALLQHGITAAKADVIIKASKKTNKAATSFTVAPL
jgi:hypothetical protein